VNHKTDETNLTRVDDDESRIRRRILLVDDNQATTTVFTMLFKRLGCEVASTNDGIKALDIAATFRPEIVLLDLSMPRMDGYETCRRIREQPGGRDMVLLAVTGLGGGETANRARLAGFDDILVKPVKADDILRLAGGRSGSHRMISASSSPMGLLTDKIVRQPQ